MYAYIVRRLLLLPLLIFGVTILIFMMISLLTPYERAALYVQDVSKRQGAIDAIALKYGLNDPITVQYWNWLVGKEDPDTGEITGGVLRGDLGWSKTGKSPVVDVIKRRLPATAELALWSGIPMIGIGIWLGVVSAVNHNKPLDQTLRVFTIVGYSIPTFVFGLVLLMTVYARFHWFSPERLSDWATRVIRSDQFIRYTQLNTVDALFNLRFDVLLDALNHLVMPAITLAYLNCAFTLRVTRSSMLDTLRQDYITTARTKGLAERMIVIKHAFPNALVPVLTVSGLTLINLFNGVVITETVFAWHGMGSFLAQAAISLDVVSVLGVTFFSSIILVMGNLLVDVLYVVVDPRVRL